jgi:ABC-2 type transport system ATP-binding protein
MSTAIALTGISKTYGDTTVLQGLDLEVAAGGVLALLGPNGAGKTTTIGILSTLVVPDAGRATVCGYDVVREADAVRRVISVTGQSSAVDGVLSARQNLRMMGRLGGLSRPAARERADVLLDRFGLDAAADKRVSTFSGGMRRKLDLAISLIGTPPVVFLDEPTTGLDTRSRQSLWDEIRALADAGTTVLLTTQYLEEADRLADRIAVLEHGVIVADGTAAELKARVGSEVLALHAADGETVLEVQTDGTLDGLRAALATLPEGASGSVALRSPSLDDVFLAVTGSPATPATPELVDQKG